MLPAGWRGGLTRGHEKFVMDADQCGMMAVFAKGMDGPLRERPGARLHPGFEQWQDGALDTARRANRVWTQLLADYQEPPLDPAIDEALLALIARRKASMPNALA